MHAFDHTLGLTMQPLTWEASQTTLDTTQPLNRTQTRNHLSPRRNIFDNVMAWQLVGREEYGSVLQGDGRERGSTPQKKQTPGFEFWA